MNKDRIVLSNMETMKTETIGSFRLVIGGISLFIAHWMP